MTFIIDLKEVTVLGYVSQLSHEMLLLAAETVTSVLAGNNMSLTSFPFCNIWK